MWQSSSKKGTPRVLGYRGPGYAREWLVSPGGMGRNPEIGSHDPYKPRHKSGLVIEELLPCCDLKRPHLRRMILVLPNRFHNQRSSR